MENPVKSRTPPGVDSRDRSKTMCACGLSHTFPFCDGSQAIAKTHVKGNLVNCGPAKQADVAKAELQVS